MGEGRDEAELRDAVQRAYGSLARDCGCGPDVKTYSAELGYSPTELESVPEGANLGLGCGNPTALADLRPGDVAVDLGSGAGFDALLAAERVGDSGRVIGVDMTDEMLDRARQNAKQAGRANVEFRKGLIEALPLQDASVDVVFSNCVINLSTDKPAVFREAFRVLRPGGRLFVSDLALSKPLPASLGRSIEAYVGCVAGALQRDTYLEALRDAGFADVRVLGESTFGPVLRSQFPEIAAAVEQSDIGSLEVEEAAESVLSLKLAARKPGGDR